MRTPPLSKLLSPLISNVTSASPHLRLPARVKRLGGFFFSPTLTAIPSFLLNSLFNFRQHLPTTRYHHDGKLRCEDLAQASDSSSQKGLHGDHSQNSSTCQLQQRWKTEQPALRLTKALPDVAKDQPCDIPDLDRRFRTLVIVTAAFEISEAKYDCRGI